MATARRTVGNGAAEVRVEHIAQIVSKLTRVPVSELTVEEREQLIQPAPTELPQPQVGA